MNCPNCGNQLKEFNLPYWDFPVFSCLSCSLIGNETSIKAREAGLSYDKFVVLNPEFEHTTSFKSVLEDQQEARDFLKKQRNSSPDFIQDQVDKLREYGYQGIVDKELMSHFAYTPTYCGFKGIARSEGIILPMFVAPCWLSGFYAIQTKIKFKSVLKKDKEIDEGGVHLFSEGKHLIFVDNLVIALNLFAQRESGDYGIGFFLPDHTSNPWDNYKKKSIILTQGLPKKFNKLRATDTEYILTSAKELIELSGQLPVKRILDTILEKSLPWEKAVTKSLLATDSLSEAKNQVNHLDLVDLDFDTLINGTEEEQKWLKRIFGRSENRYISLGTRSYFRFSSGGLKEEYKNKTKQVADADIRVEEIIHTPDKTFYKGILKYKNRDIEFIEPIESFENPDDWLVQKAREEGLKVPNLDSGFKKDWLDICLEMSDPKITEAYHRAGYHNDCIALPGITITDKIENKNLIFPKPDKLLYYNEVEIPEALLADNYGNKVFWATFTSFAHQLCYKMYDNEMPTVFLLGNSHSFAGQLYQTFYKSFKLDQDIEGYPKSRLKQDIPLAGLAVSLHKKLNLIPALCKKKYDLKELVSLVVKFLYFLLMNKKNGINSLPARQLDNFIYFMTEKNTNIKPYRHIFSYTRLPESPGYQISSKGLRFIVLTMYLEEKNMLDKKDLEFKENKVKLAIDKILHKARDAVHNTYDVVIAEIIDSLEFEGALEDIINHTTITINKDYWNFVKQAFQRVEKRAPILNYV